MTKRCLTRLEIVKLSNLIEANVEKLDGGLVRYKGDWTDEKAAHHIAADLNATHAARLRTELFGPLIGARGQSDEDISKQLNRYRDQIVELQAKLADETAARVLLEKRHRHLWSQFDKLCDAISLNRVLDVRSCKYRADTAVANNGAAEANAHT